VCTLLLLRLTAVQGKNATQQQQQQEDSHSTDMKQCESLTEENITVLCLSFSGSEQPVFEGLLLRNCRSMRSTSCCTTAPETDATSSKSSVRAQFELIRLLDCACVIRIISHSDAQIAQRTSKRESSNPLYDNWGPGDALCFVRRSKQE
jgi:hypothetical protein